MQPNEYITSDTHFGHGNIVRRDFANRPWPARPVEVAELEAKVCSGKANDVERAELKVWLKDHVHEMDAELIRRWNEKVPERATVYHLGDFGLARADRLREIIEQLHGRIRLLTGNHDKELMKNKDLQALFEWFRPHAFHESRGPGRQKIVMCHYAFDVWNKSHHGSWMLHGHSHGSLPTGGRVRMDVGVDAHPNYEPFSYAEIAEKLSGLEPPVLDHHRKPGS